MNKIKKQTRVFLALLLAAALVLPGSMVSTSVVAQAANPFGDGSDGDLTIGRGQTVTLPVSTPHVSVVEKNYRNITIEAGGTLRCSAPNAGLVLKATGNVTIKGTIDQSGMAPKTNPGNTYPYPTELICGAGGKGQDYISAPSRFNTRGGRGMSARKYGGGYGGGAAGGGEVTGNGGDADTITIDVPNIFVGGARGGASGNTTNSNKVWDGGDGAYGGGGGGRGHSDKESDGNYSNLQGGAGGNGAGADGQVSGHDAVYSGSCGGGAGNVGGGVVLLYIAGTGSISGSIDCSGLKGGDGGHEPDYFYSPWGNGGGGGGGGAVYIEYRSTAPSISGTLSVSGGAGGKGGPNATNPGWDGEAGKNGTTTIKRTQDYTPPVVNSVTIPTAWGQTNTVTVNATDGETGVASYAVTSANSSSGASWQTSSSFVLSGNGTYYAWAKDGVDNVSAGKAFTVSQVDTAAPVVNSAIVTPSGWTNQANKTITVSATDGQSGIAGYGITTTTAAPTTWQTSNVFSKPAGIYYLWAKDNVGRVSVSKQAVLDKIDTAVPVISGVTVPTAWGQTNTVTVNATDSGGSGIAGYAVSTGAAAPGTGWQTSASFTLSANGSYYAFVKDGAGNTTPGKAFSVSKVDTSMPVVNSAVVTPSGWTNQANKTITVSATDAQSGIAGYGITTTTTAPTSWQTSNVFSKPGGTYYLWAKDNVGRISAFRQVAVDQIDTAVPIISSVTVPTAWGQSNTVTINAADSGGSGIAQYAVSTGTTAPGTGWQTSASFTLSANGSYYAFVKDAVGNITQGKAFSVSKVDTVKPVIEGIEIPDVWNLTSVVTVNASDHGGSGIAEYAVSDSASIPTTGWQSSPSFTLSANGGYYAFVKDQVGNITSGKYFVISKVDTTKPQVTSVLVDGEWAYTVPVTIYANDMGSGVAEYAYSKENTPPQEGWQSSGSFGITENGGYYAWARDKAGNISDGKTFGVRTVDRERPTVTGVKIPEDWATDSRVTLSADDVGGGVKEYAVSTGAAAPGIGWQTSPSFILDKNGDYFAFVRDKAGNVSEGFPFAISKVDTEKPTVKKATVSLGWSNVSVVELEAGDVGSGVKEYVISSYTYAPSTGWQTSPSFTLDKNGTFYAFVRDFANNLSSPFRFEVSQVDREKPVVTKVNIPLGWSSVSEISLEASDVGSGVVDYAVTQDSAPPPGDGWQTSPDFTLDKNGSYYAWAKDLVGNVSQGKFFPISKVDRTPPSIGSIGYNTDYTILMVRGKDSQSGVKQIYLDGVPYEGSTVSWDVPSGTRYVKVQVEDVAENRSEEVTERIPGWFDVLDTITILPVEFIDENKKAVVTAESSSGSEILGIYVNGKLAPGNPVTYPISAGLEYLELQAQDAAGDRSAVYRVRVPGWSQESGTISIVDVRFSEDSSMAQITAMETGGKGIKGIRVNGELLPGNPVTYSIPEGTKHLEMQAEDNDGDRSTKLIRRVPGWSQVVTTLAISDVTFLDYNTTAQITATATGGDSVSGIEVNGEPLQGNPVIYTVPKGTTVLHLQALNPEGDRSPMVNKMVPQDSSKSTLKIDIEDPGWTKSRSVKIKLTVTDVTRITKVLVRTSEDREWRDVTEQRYIVIDQDTTVYASAENDKGEIREASQSIECFDTTAPKVTAAQDGKNINIRATDDRSGVVSILVNNKEYQRGDFEEGKLTWRIPAGTTLVTIKAEDAAGNLSRQLELPIQNTTTALPVIVAPAPTPAPSSTPNPPPTEGALPAPPDEPTAEPEAEPMEPEPVQTVLEPVAEPISPAVQAAAAVGTVGASAAGGLWYLLRKKRRDKPIEELDTEGKKRLYDESEYGGPIDPLDKKEGDKKC